MYDSLLPNLFSWAGFVTLATGVVKQLRTPGRNLLPLDRHAARGMLWAYGFMQAGLILWIASLWIDAGGWIPTKLIVTAIAFAAFVFVVAPAMHNLAQRASLPDDTTERS